MSKKNLILYYFFIYQPAQERQRKLKMQGSCTFTSNNAMVGLSYEALSRAGVEIPTGWVFDNASVVKMMGNPDGSSNITMIHPKKVSDETRFLSPEKFNQTFQGASLKMKPGKVRLVLRHGHAGHNDRDATLDIAHDAYLTPTGIEQMLAAGRAIVDDPDFAQISEPLDFKTSDLRRTWQSAFLVRSLFPRALQPQKATIRIEAHEYIRAIGYEHHWRQSDPLRELAIDPYRSVAELQVLAPDKSPEQIKRMLVENLPKNDPLGNWEKCDKEYMGMELDWSEYVAKLQTGKTFGQAASERTLLDVILED
jgi:hypothetical protein